MSTPTEYAQEVERIRARRLIAAQLAQQAANADSGTQMAGRIAIARSPLEGLAQLAQSYQSNRIRRKSEADEAAAVAKRAKETEAALAKINDPNASGAASWLREQEPQMVHGADQAAKAQAMSTVMDPEDMAKAQYVAQLEENKLREVSPGASLMRGAEVVGTAPGKEGSLHLERKVRDLVGMKQDYNFDPSGQVPDENVGPAYKSQDPSTTQIMLNTPESQDSIRSDAMAVVQGLLPTPVTGGMGASGMRNAQVRKMVYELNPKHDATIFKKRQETIDTFTKGPDGRGLDALNTVAQHRELGIEAAQALKNNDVQGINRIAQAIGVQFGADAPTTFGYINQFLANEVARATIGGQNAQADRQEFASNMSKYFAQGQFDTAFQAMGQLIGGRFNAARRRYQAGTRTYDPDKKGFQEHPEEFDALLTESGLNLDREAQALGQKHAEQRTDGPAAVGKPGSQTNPIPVTTPAQARGLGPGTYFKNPQGKILRVPGGT